MCVCVVNNKQLQVRKRMHNDMPYDMTTRRTLRRVANRLVNHTARNTPRDVYVQHHFTVPLGGVDIQRHWDTLLVPNSARARLGTDRA
jgi:hypothetical protein